MKRTCLWWCADIPIVMRYLSSLSMTHFVFMPARFISEISKRHLSIHTIVLSFPKRYDSDIRTMFHETLLVIPKVFTHTHTRLVLHATKILSSPELFVFQDGLTVNFGSVGWYSTIYLNSAPESRRITNGATSKWAVPPMGFALLIFYDIQRISRGRIRTCYFYTW